MSKNTILAALQYASLGWYIFPIQPKSKQPFSKNSISSENGAGLKASSRDPDTIRYWWSRWPSANIGIVTGLLSGIVVLDIDPKSCGLWSLVDLQNRVTLPTTLTSFTGSGGQHRIYHNPGIPIPNSVGKLGPGLDIRGENGYIVAPPSIHPNGHPYRWSISPYQHPESITIFPESLISQVIILSINKPKEEKQELSPNALTDKEGLYFVSQALAQVHSGVGRNQAGFHLACQLRDWGFSINQATRYMRFFVNMVPKRDHIYKFQEATNSLKTAYSSPRRYPAKEVNNHEA